MKKLTIIFISLIVFTFNVRSQITKQDIQDVANTFLRNNGNSVEKTSATLEPIAIQSTNNEALAYVVELNPGYIIISPSKELSPIIAYSFKNDFNFKESSNNMLLDIVKMDMKGQLSYLENIKSTDDLEKIDLNKKKWDNYIEGSITSLKATTQIGPLLTDIWGGVNCYTDEGVMVYVGNYYTPNHYSPGCVATSLSQILNYYEWPKTGVGSHTDDDNRGSTRGDFYADFSATTYDYANMLDEYQGVPSTDDQRAAMGLLAYHCGIAVDMDYEDYGGTSNVNRSPYALNAYFRSTGHHEYLSSYSSFWSNFNENLETGAPLHLAVYATNGAGHAIVCDGYEVPDGTSTEYYHLTMGWWGAANGWYNLKGSFSAGGYSIVSAAVFDIYPDPLMLSPEIVDDSYTIKWEVSQQLNWEAFELQQSYNGGSWTTISNNITETNYTLTLTDPGNYRYQVRAKVNGVFHDDNYSEPVNVSIEGEITEGDLVYLDFDGDDSFFIRDNSDNDFDISSNWTIETWVNVDNYTVGTYPVIIDRRTVFSMYLVADDEGDYGIRFVARKSQGSISASVRTDYSSTYLHFGEWYHVAVTRDGYTTRIFINGQEVDSSTDSDFNLTATSYALNIGARYWGSYDRYLDGKIDGVSISAEAKYTTDFTPERFEQFIPNSNSVLLVPMQEGVGTILSDLSGNFTNITLRSDPNLANWLYESLLKSSTAITSSNVEIESSISNSLEIYPNPASDYLFLNLERNQGATVQIKLFDINGKVAKIKNLETIDGNQVLKMDISTLKQGIYILQLITPDKSFKKKIIIEK
ncbi:MAG: C10 family peptidase [Bacteroidota bacterium]